MAGRTTFTKRLKEQARQQKKRDKADRKIQRRLEKQAGVPEDANELERLAHEQAALFHIDDGTSQTPKTSDDDVE
jgi:hypothetical protein